MTDEIEVKLKPLHDALVEAQSRFDKVAEGKADTTDLEAATKAVEGAAAAIDTINKDRAEEKAAADAAKAETEKKIAFLEGQIARGVKSDDNAEDDPEYKRAVHMYLRKGIAPDAEVVERVYTRFAEKSIFGADDREIENAKKDLVAASGPDGGYFITADRGGIVEGRIFETSPVRQVASVVSTSSDSFELILDDQEGDSGWVGEVQARPDTTTPQVGLIKIPVHEVYAQPMATQKMIDDAGFDIEGWLAGKVASQIGRKENSAFVAGDGAQKPKGFLSYANFSSAGVYTRNAVEQIETGTASVIKADDLIGIQNALKEEYQANATWGLKRGTFTDIAQLKDEDGQYLLNPRVLMEGSTKMLLGADVIFMDDVPAVADSALSIAIADWSRFYTIVDRFGIRVLRDPYTNKPYVRYYTTKRVGGAVTNYEAGKILKIKAT